MQTGSQTNISQVLLVAGNIVQREFALAALARSKATVELAADVFEAKKIIWDKPEHLLGLIIFHVNFMGREDPLILYKEIRSNPATRTVPMVMVVETSMERAMIQKMGLTNCCCLLAPLTYGSLVFALPSLGIEINDSILYQKYQSQDLAETRALPVQIDR